MMLCLLISLACIRKSRLDLWPLVFETRANILLPRRRARPECELMRQRSRDVYTYFWTRPRFVLKMNGSILIVHVPRDAPMSRSSSRIGQIMLLLWAVATADTCRAQ